MLYLEPARIREYMKIIADKEGQQEVMKYIVVVLGQFLQNLANHRIFQYNFCMQAA